MPAGLYPVARAGGGGGGKGEEEGWGRRGALSPTARRSGHGLLSRGGVIGAGEVRGFGSLGSQGTILSLDHWCP